MSIEKIKKWALIIGLSFLGFSAGSIIWGHFAKGHVLMALFLYIGGILAAVLCCEVAIKKIKKIEKINAAKKIAQESGEQTAAGFAKFLKG